MQIDNIYNHLERLAQLARMNARQVANEYGLLPIQAEALHYLSRCNKYSDTPLAVAEYLGQTKGTVSQTLKLLERKGLIKKLPDQSDKRLVHLQLTREGRSVLDSFAPTRAFRQLEQHLSPEQLSQIQNSLDLLLRSQIVHNNYKAFDACKSCRFNQKEPDGSFYCGLLKQPLKPMEVEQICKEHQYPEAVLTGQ